MVVITFAYERGRGSAILFLKNRFGDGSVKVAGRWMRLLVTDTMVEELVRRGVPFTVIPESQLAAEQEEVEIGSRLYDLQLRDYPSERGSVFRSVQVFECWVCGALSNLVVMGGSPNMGIRVLCPNRTECWHHEVEDAIGSAEQGTPAPFEDEMRDMVHGLRSEHAAEIVNDVRGAADVSQKRPMTNVRGYKKEWCKHFSL